mmetsp:Transcript_12274/g.23297  ORF Transcript_12274/g.23297 Transcript_12274/m.23297 type:complete len:117 (+) Transcript_12274:96-446(+)|eukprot:CAMPEP_0114257870 /NCGR_PEP_ID=MMETSP0058-20121206/18978_1 /TAXON_ID=36894 /ORGANISM="Pyramimonas parkeae, CCMP726" /LENGTH=116 /DNA_ID=CAMNT_0001372655 /DNA_START=40 /DNA_END=390 /DNA_ORIENTATION=-
MEAPAVRAAKAALWTTGTHLERSRRLYRHSLKTLLSWCIHREIFHVEADKIRAEFEANRHSPAGETLLKNGIQKLLEHAHPEPWTLPTEYGGSKWQRNVPIHDSVEIVLDYGREQK